MDAEVVIRIRSQSQWTTHQRQGSIDSRRTNANNTNHAAAHQPTTTNGDARKHRSQTTSGTNTAAGNGAVHDEVHRSWTLSVKVNDSEPHEIELRDPFTEKKYEKVFERYLRNSEKPSLILTAGHEDDHLDVPAAEDLIRSYTQELFDQLDKRLGLSKSGVRKYHIFVVEDHSSKRPSMNQDGIQCLAWELLESVPEACIRITRVSNFIPGENDLIPKVPQELASVKNGSFFKVLLVVARDFTRSGANRDPEPDLAQYPLMTVQKKLRAKGKGRMLLEVVRPGSREELEAHLDYRWRQEVVFHLVHFDLHGIVQPDDKGNMVPWLLFAKKHDESVGQQYNLPGTCLAKAAEIASVLARYRVENVVLNSCLSAYNRRDSGTNLAQIFLRYGVSNVSAMWYYVHWQTVSTYLEAFYNELFVSGSDFHAAAHKGREVIRRRFDDKTGRRFQDFFICVNYKRESHAINKVPRDRDRSPSISDQSQDSSTSSSSRTKWKSPTVLLGDNLKLPMDEPIRMKLHLLELEYKLTTFRVVYASDLQRSDSKMETTIDQMISMWLATNLVDEVYFYRAKDLDKPNAMLDGLPYREKRTRLQASRYLLSSTIRESVRSLRKKLLVIRGIDDVLDPGTQAYADDNQRNEKRRHNVEQTLERLTRRVHMERDSYLLFIGSKDAQWWRGHLEHLDGQWWLHMPWNITVHSRYNRDIMVPGDGGRRSLTPSPIGSRW